MSCERGERRILQSKVSIVAYLCDAEVTSALISAALTSPAYLLPAVGVRNMLIR